MAQQIGEYISSQELKKWTALKDVATFENGKSFVDGTEYTIYNNGGSSIRFIAVPDENTKLYGTVMTQGDLIHYKPQSGITLYIKGSSFNLAISEV